MQLQGYAKPPKKDAISDSDLDKIDIFLLNQVYDTPQNLQYATWFLLFHFFAIIIYPSVEITVFQTEIH